MNTTTEKPEAASEKHPDCYVWLRVALVTFYGLVLCIILNRGTSAIALAILLHAEIRYLEHDERIQRNRKATP